MSSWDDPSVVLSAGPVFSRSAEDDDPPPGPVRPVGFTTETDATPARDPHVVELEAAIDRVRALHSQDTSVLEAGRWCLGCGEETPCPTIRALNGQAQQPGRFS